MSTAMDSHKSAMDGAADYLARAIREIDEKFGAHYASNNPLLVAAFIRTCAQEFATMQSSDR